MKKIPILLIYFSVCYNCLAQISNLKSTVSRLDMISNSDSSFGIGDDDMYPVCEPVLMTTSVSSKKYSVQNLVDYNLGSAWVFDTCDEKSSSVTYEFNLAKSGIKKRIAFKITEMYFFNGYRRSILSWRNYSRVKFVSLSINGLLLVKVRLMDTYKMQIIDLKKLSINAYYGKSLKITLKFDGLYFGGKYLNDIAISEIIFDQKRY